MTVLKVILAFVKLIMDKGKIVKADIANFVQALGAEVTALSKSAAAGSPLSIVGADLGLALTDAVGPINAATTTAEVAGIVKDLGDVTAQLGGQLTAWKWTFIVKAFGAFLQSVAADLATMTA